MLPPTSGRPVDPGASPVHEALRGIGPIFWEAWPSGALRHDVPTWRAYTGQAEPLPTSGWLDAIVHPAEREATVLAWAQGLQTAQPISITHRLRAADGTYHPFLTQANPVRDAAGSLNHWQGVTCYVGGALHADDQVRWQAQSFSATHDAVIMTDLSGCITDWNPAAEALFGYTHAEVIGQTIAILGHEAGAPTEDMLVALQRDGVWHGEADFMRKDGSRGRYAVEASPLCTAQGEIVGTLCIHRDITARSLRKAHFEYLLDQERALRRDVEVALATAQAVETKYRTLIERNIIGVFIADADHIIEANDAFLTKLGYTQADVAARMIPWKALTPPGWVVADDRASHELITQGACTPYEKVYLHKDGTPVPIILAGALLEWQPLRIMGFALDITERKRFEQESASHAAELEAVLDAMTDGVLVYDAQHYLIRTNAAARALNPGTTQQDYLDETFAQRITRFALRDGQGHSLPAEDTPVARVMGGERLISADLRMRLPDGNEIALNASGAPIRTPDGRFAGAVIVSRDVTAQRTLERRVHDALNALLTIAEALVPAPDFPQAMGIDAVAGRLAELTVQVLGCKRVSLHGVDQITGRVAPLAIAGLSPELTRDFMTEQRALNQTLATTDADFLAHMRAGEPLVFDFTQPPSTPPRVAMAVPPSPSCRCASATNSPAGWH